MSVSHQILGRLTGRTSGVNDTRLVDESRKQDQILERFDARSDSVQIIRERHKRLEPWSIHRGWSRDPCEIGDPRRGCFGKTRQEYE